MTAPAAIADASHPLRRLGAAAWFASLSFLLVCVALQLLRGDLDWRHAQLSAYLHGPYGLLLRTFYVVMALALVALATGLYASLAPAARSAAPLGLFVAAAIGLAAVAVGGSYLPEAAPALAPRVHALAAQTAFLCMAMAMLLQNWRFRGDARWRAMFAPAFVLACSSFILLWVHVLWRAAPRGSSQKLVILCIVGWALLVAWRLWRGETSCISLSNHEENQT